MRLWLLPLCWLSLIAGPLCAQQNAPRDRHPWGRFAVGSWKTVRVYKETFANGAPAGSSVEESKTTLVAADDKQYTLQVDSRITAAGQEFDSDKSLTLTYYGTLPGQALEILTIDEQAAVELEGQSVACRLIEIKFETDSLRWVSKRHLSDLHHEPLRLETLAVHPQDGSLVMKTLSQVRGRRLLHQVMGQQRQAAIVQTSVHRPMSIQTTHELHCSDVPGVVVASWSKTTDRGGQISERSTLQLIDFGVPGTAPAEQP